MRVLFLGANPIWTEGPPNGFRDAGHEVRVSGFLIKKSLSHMISDFHPDLIFTIGWGFGTNWKVDRKLKDWIRDNVKGSGIPHIYWATEDPTHTQSFTLPYLQEIQPDFVFTICAANVEFYRQQGFKSAHLDFGFDPSIHFPGEPLDDYRASLAVVANAYPQVLDLYPDHYRRTSLQMLIRPLLEENLRIDFYGSDWHKMEPFLGFDIPEEWIHDYLPYTDTNKLYNSADIMIGLQNHQTQLTQRTYEILGSGGFLITNDTPEIRRLFTPARDLVVSANAEDTIRMVRYYLTHPEERKQIAIQGSQTVFQHSYKRRAEYMIEVLQSEGIINKDKC